jgi:hypothetical protein
MNQPVALTFTATDLDRLASAAGLVALLAEGDAPSSPAARR